MVTATLLASHHGRVCMSVICTVSILRTLARRPADVYSRTAGSIPILLGRGGRCCQLHIPLIRPLLQYLCKVGAARQHRARGAGRHRHLGARSARRAHRRRVGLRQHDPRHREHRAPGGRRPGRGAAAVDSGVRPRPPPTGPDHAAQLAAAEALLRPHPRPLDQVFAELREAWTVKQRCLDRLDSLQPQHDTLRAVVALQAAPEAPPGGRARLHSGPCRAAERCRPGHRGRRTRAGGARDASPRCWPTRPAGPARRSAHRSTQRVARPRRRSLPVPGNPATGRVGPAVPRPEYERRGPSLTGGASPGLAR